MSDQVQFTFQGTSVKLPAGTTSAQARNLLAASMPDIKNADFVAAGGDGGGTFVPRTGTKG